jgi:hypothetical protein
MFESDSADMCAGKFQLVSMGGRAEGLPCAAPGARTPIGASGNSIYSQGYPERSHNHYFISNSVDGVPKPTTLNRNVWRGLWPIPVSGNLVHFVTIEWIIMNDTAHSLVHTRNRRTGRKFCSSFVTFVLFVHKTVRTQILLSRNSYYSWSVLYLSLYIPLTISDYLGQVSQHNVM